MRFIAAVALAICSTALGGCPQGPPLPGPLGVDPLIVNSVTLADGAPAADPNDPPTVIAPADVPDGVQVFDLGDLGVTDGETGDILVDIGQGLGTITVLAYGQDGQTVILARAVDPDGNLVVSDVDPSPLPDVMVAFARGFPAQVFSKNRVLGSLTTGSFLVPNTPSVAAKSGRWKLRVGQYAVDFNVAPPRRQPIDRPVHVILLVRGQDSGHGTIDLNLHFTGGDLTAATAPTDSLLQGALDVMRTAYAGAKIDIGEVRYKDIDPAFATIALAAGRCEAGDLDRVVAQGVGDEPGIDLFFVDHFTCLVGGATDVGAGIGGIAAAIPGPPWVHGSNHSGVAVSTTFAAGDPKPLGVVMAHETGHFLGLYHTRESGAGANIIYDGIDDTPENADAAANLMYFAAQDDTTLTDGQAHVLRTNPFVVPSS